MGRWFQNNLWKFHKTAFDPTDHDKKLGLFLTLQIVYVC
jgi:hypothetical protein